MALSGLEIYKHLPKTNCKDCGVPTCLAFAMKVAAGQAGIEQCPHVSDEAKAALSEAGAPPQTLVSIGSGEAARQIGQETVLFRHEERFHRPTAVGVRLLDNDESLREKAAKIGAVSFERVGQVLSLDLVAVENASGDSARFAEAAREAAEASGKALVLRSADPQALKTAAAPLKDRRPLLWPLGTAPEEAVSAAAELDLPIVLEAPDLERAEALTRKAKEAGIKEMLISPAGLDALGTLQFLTLARRAAIKKKHRPLGYPAAVTAFSREDPIQAVIDACWYVLKYAGVLLVDVLEPELLLSILTTRQDIYTDPQVPVQVEPGLHAVGDPGKDAPVLITTNFALSYYSVESEVEASRVGSYIIAVDTEGTSVLTAWAADKLNAATIKEAVENSGVAAKVEHKTLVLPGLVAVLRAGTEDETGWKAVVGPKEASGLVSFLKNQWKP